MARADLGGSGLKKKEKKKWAGWKCCRSFCQWLLALTVRSYYRDTERSVRARRSCWRTQGTLSSSFFLLFSSPTWRANQEQEDRHAERTSTAQKLLSSCTALLLIKGLSRARAPGRTLLGFMFLLTAPAAHNPTRSSETSGGLWSCLPVPWSDPSAPPVGLGTWAGAEQDLSRSCQDLDLTLSWKGGAHLKLQHASCTNRRAMAHYGTGAAGNRGKRVHLWKMISLL